MTVNTQMHTVLTGTLENRREFLNYAGVVTFGALSAGIMFSSTNALADGCEVSSWGEAWVTGVSGVFVVTGGAVILTAGTPALAFVGGIVMVIGVSTILFPTAKKVLVEKLDELENQIMGF